MQRILSLLVRFFCLDPVFSSHPARVLLAARSSQPPSPQHGGQVHAGQNRRQQA